jgi:hypothetical protein
LKSFGCEILDNAKGAFINVVMWASSIEEYGRKSKSTVGEMKLFVVDIARPEPVRARRDRESDFGEEIEEIIARSEEYPDEIVFGTFHLYEKDDG